MATTVENRVVAMEFDNKNFEKNMSKTMKTLEEFDEKLNFKGAQKGFNTLENAAKKCDISPLSNAVTSLEMKFSALQIAGVTAISKIVSSAMDAGTRIVKSLTLDPISTGFGQYETKITSVQTIMNATGKTIEQVEEALERLAMYTDETSYSFGDMVNNIGKFTSNNVELERAVSSMQGISNWAAVSGQNAQKAEQVMRNLSQALSLGAVTVQDWMSVENANMATSEFKQTVIDTAKAMGVLNQEGKDFKGNLVTVETFRSTLSDKWFTNEVLIKTLEKYNSYSDAVMQIMANTNITAREAMAEIDKYIEESGDETLKFGQKAFKAAQETKTFTDALNYVKDAAKTGWQRTFDLIIGNYVEATEMWTNLTDILYEVFVAGAEARNEMLGIWKDLGGRDLLINTISTAFKNASAVVGAFKKALTDVFPPITGTRLYEFTKGVNAFVKQLKFSDEALKTVTNAVRTLLLPLKIVVNILEMGAIGAAILTVQLFRLADSFLAANSEGGIFNNLMLKIFGEERYTRLGNAMNKILNNLGMAFSKLVGWVTGLFKQTPQAENMHKIFDAISKVLSPIAGWILDRLVDGFELLANLDFSNLINLGSDILNGIVSAFQSIIQYVPPVTGNIGEFLKKFSTATPAEFFTIIADGFKQLSLKWSQFKANFTISGLAKTINNQFNNLMSIVDNLGDAFVRLVERLNPAKILISAFGVSLVGTIWSVKKALEAGTNVMNSFSGVLGAFKKRIEPKTINPTVKSLILLAGALTIMALVPADRLKQATFSMLGLMGALTVVTAIISGLTATIDKAKIKTGAVKQLSITMSYISAAVLILAAAMKVLSTVDLDGIGTRLLVLITIIGSLAAACILMSKFAKDLTKGSIFMISYATSVNLLVTALQKLAESDLKGIKRNLSSLVVIIGFLGVVAVAASHVDFKSAVGLTMVIIDVIALCGLLKILSLFNIKSLFKSLVSLIPIIIAISYLGLAIQVAGKDAAKVGATFLSLSASVLVLAAGIKALSSLSLREIAVGGAAISGMIVIFGLFTQFAKMDKGKTTAKLGATFITMSVAIAILTGAIYLLGNIKEEVVKKGTAVVLAILSMFTIIIAVGGKTKGAIGVILSMTAAIGVLTSGLMLLTLVDGQELMIAAAAMSAVFVAFGVAMANLKAISFKDAMASIAPMAIIVSGLTGVLYVLGKAKMENVLGSALALSGLLLAISAMTNIMKSIDGRKYESYIKTIKLVGLFLAEAVAALGILSIVNGDKMLEKAASLSLLIVAMTTVTTAISHANINSEKVKKGGQAIDLAILIIGGLIAGIGLLDEYLFSGALSRSVDNGAAIVSKLLVIVPVIAALGTITAIFGKLDINPAAAAKAAAAMDIIIIIVGALVGIVGWLDDIMGGDLNSFVERGGPILLEVANIIGGFYGNLISSLGSSLITGLIPAITDGITSFIEGIKPFISFAKDYDKSINDNILNFVEAVGAISLVGAIWKASDFSFEEFGENFKDFGYYLKTFIKSISDMEFDESKVDTASNAARAIAQILAVIPTEGGLKGAIFGSIDFGGFVEALDLLGPAIAKLATDVEGISPNAFDNAISALGVVAEFAKNEIPPSGGLLQMIVGEQDLGVFGDQLAKFSTGFKKFSERTADLDAGIVKRSKWVGKSLTNIMSVEIPNTGGLLAKLIGDNRLDEFGEQLADFANDFKRFSDRTKDLDASVVKRSKWVADSLSKMASVDIPNTGGLIGRMVGNNDIDDFGEKLADFSTDFKKFFDRTAGIDESIVNRSEWVADSLSKMASVDIPNSGGLIGMIVGNNDLDKFGERLEGLGTSLSNFHNSVWYLDMGRINNGITAISKIAKMSDDLSNFDTSGANTFLVGVNSLSKLSLDEFANTWVGASESIAETINSTLSDVATYLTEDTGISESAEIMVEGFIDGINNSKNDIETSGHNLGKDFAVAVNDKHDKMVNAGKYLVSGLSTGITQGITLYLEDTIKSLTDNIIETTENNLGIASPSKKFAEIGRYIIEGLRNGIRDNTNISNDSILEASNGIYDTITDYFDINSPSVKMEEIGKYIIQGIGEGMKNDMTVEEIVEKKMENIFTAFSNAASLQSKKFQQNNLLYEIWQLEHQLASNEESINKERTFRQEELTEAIKEYNDAKAEQQALDKIGADPNSEKYLEIQNKILEAKKNVLTVASELYNFDIETTKALREQEKAISDLKAESRDLEYSRWELLNKNASAEEKYNRQEEIQKSKLIDQQNEYNRLVETANDLINQGYDLESTEVLTAVNAVNSAYNDMLDTVSNINELNKKRKEDTKSEANTLKELRSSYYEELKKYSDLIENGGLGFSENYAERFEQIAAPLRKKFGLDENLNLLKIDEETLETLIDIANLKEVISEPIDINVNIDSSIFKLIKDAGYDEDFLADFPIFDDTLVYEKSTSTGRTIGSGVASGVSDELYESNNINIVPDWLNNIMKKVGGTTVEDGGELADGYGSGFMASLTRGSDTVLESVKEWGSGIVETGKEALGVHSPSTYMKEVGEFFILGFINGIEDKSESAYKAVEDFCQHILTIASENLSSPNSGILSPVIIALDNIENSDDFQPVIRPVVDMDYLNSQLKEAKSAIAKAFVPFSNTSLTAAKTASEISKTRSQNEAIISQRTSSEGPSTVNFYQTNNSPKALNRLEIYRDGQALVSQIKTIIKHK